VLWSITVSLSSGMVPVSPAGRRSAGLQD